MLYSFCITFKSNYGSKISHFLNFFPSFHLSIQFFSVDNVYIVITVAVNMQRYMLNLILTNDEPIFN